MEIIKWNCNMAFLKKAEFILKHQPDILIVPKCENPEKLIFKNDVPKPSDFFWYGNKPNRVYNHSNLVEFLKDKNNNSTYQTFCKVE